ncbi:MAG: GNAT family N-acetyltransferase [Actinomycetota bacterium]
MVVVRWLEPDVAGDLALAPAVTDVVNRAYAHAEVGLFATKIERTDIDHVRTSISRRQTAVALEDGAVVGSIRAGALDGRTGWFGALGVDPAMHGRRFGDALVRFVEDDAAAAGRGAMRFEVLESQPIHPHLSRIREWYERRGYRETSRLPLAALYREDAAKLLVARMDVVTMRKQL